METRKGGVYRKMDQWDQDSRVYSLLIALGGFLHSRINSEDGKSRKQLGLNHGVSAIPYTDV